MKSATKKRKWKQGHLCFTFWWTDSKDSYFTLWHQIWNESEENWPFHLQEICYNILRKIGKKSLKKKIQKAKRKILLHAILVRRPPPPKSRFQSFCRKQNLLWNVPVLQQCCKTCKTSRFDRISFLGGVNWAPPRECVFLSFKIIVFSNQ